MCYNEYNDVYSKMDSDFGYDYGMVFEFMTVISALKLLEFDNEKITHFLKAMQVVLSDEEMVGRIDYKARKFMGQEGFV